MGNLLEFTLHLLNRGRKLTSSPVTVRHGTAVRIQPWSALG